MRSDEEIQRAVERELEWDSRVDHTSIGVSVRSGVVTLSGTVDSWPQRLAAQKAAHRVSGVLDVASEIGVKLRAGGARTDADIAEAVRLALQWDVRVPHEAIHSTVSDGRVTLHGEVESLNEREDAEHAVAHLSGVRFVLNELAVKPRPAAGREDVRNAIFDALERRAVRELHRIRVDDEDGVVTLTGTCRTWAEKKAVVGAARGTPGVRSVRDELWIAE